jgi:NitT/TauT family transport system substrate-binding protein
VLAYGSGVIKDPPDPSRFAELGALQAIDKTGLFKEQTIAIAPIRTASAASVETDPLLSKDIRFLFEPNSASLDQANQDNIKNLEAIKRLLQVSPGSTLLLRGHVDNARVEDFRKMGGEAYVRTQALRAMELSKNRAGEIRKLLVDRYTIDAKRIDIVGRGWEEPAGPNSDLNRRVEVQWFTVE